MSSILTEWFDDRDKETDDQKAERWDRLDDDEAREQERVDTLRAHGE